MISDANKEHFNEYRYGILLSIDRPALRAFMDEETNPNVHKTDIVIQLDGERFEFSLDEFRKKLGFD